ncbi:hypothetical protein HMPREF3038_02081 [Akkermansia sp. KLE1797]|nr:hypothetical protein HMPREF3038_02081 [Akkermansia sp. KLE1797]KZA05782.1 hypothetical protein HMPREF1326_00609 [Akkermansia sp. KLE1605]
MTKPYPGTASRAPLPGCAAGKRLYPESRRAGYTGQPVTG